MKLVIQTQNTTETRTIKESEFEPIIKKIKLNHLGNEEIPKKYELFRFKLTNGVIIIYRDNKALRTKNNWFEIRALKNLSQISGELYYHQVIIKANNNQEFEVDGLSIDRRTEMVEVKNTIINQDWIKYYDHKRKLLNIKNCIIVASEYRNNISIPSSISCYTFKPDMKALLEYYNSKFDFPDWIKPFIPSRHIRMHLDNGVWKGVKRKLTNTAKHTSKTKLVLAINNLAKRNKYPIKLYYSLSPMLIPVDEFNGKGRPLPYILGAIDVDANQHNHIIGEEGYCLNCLKSVEEKIKIVSERIAELSYNYIKIHSGSKGMHFYILEENGESVKQFTKDKFYQLVSILNRNYNGDLIDNVKFTSKNKSLDLHRIFKIPNSTDGSTGIILQEKLKQLRFHDYFEKLK